jgi:cell division protein ZapD
MAVRSRAAIPGGTCGFDLPAYHAWQHGQAANRRADLHRWVASLEPLAQAIALLLQMLRDSGKPRMVTASAGQYQQGCPRAARRSCCACGWTNRWAWCPRSAATAWRCRCG